MASIEKRRDCNNKISYRVKVRLKGVPEQTATFERLSDARRWAQTTEAAIREGRYFKSSEAKRHTMAEMIDRYISDVLPSKKEGKNQASQLAWWKSELGNYSLEHVTPSLIAEYRGKLALGSAALNNPRSAATVNRYLAALSHVLTTAMREWGWIDDNPLRKVRKLKEPRGRVRYLSDDERKRLLIACKHPLRHPHLYPVVILALSTGARSGELLGLTWGCVDLDRRCAVLHETKNGERRVLPLSGHALELLKELYEVRRPVSPLVFPGRNPYKPVELRKAWLASLAAADIENFRFHDLRHSAASYLAMNGATLGEIAEVLGHKTLAMVKRYSHLSESHVSKVIASMNDKMFGNLKTT